MTGETDAFLLSGKDIMGVFDEVKERVTARAVMERAGIVFNRGNMCKCPFHQDKTASMKVKPMDKKYFCFGCGEKGDAIDFVAKYYNLWRMITSVCRMRRICLGFHGKNWQKSQGAKKLEDFWIPPSAIIKGGSQERVFSYSLMLRMYITSWMMGMIRKKIQYPWR